MVTAVATPDCIITGMFSWIVTAVMTDASVSPADPLPVKGFDLPDVLHGNG